MALVRFIDPRSRLTVALRILVALPLLALAACGGSSRAGPIKIEGPSIPPLRVVPIRTLEPAPTETPTPSPTPTPVPTPTATPIPPPSGASVTSGSATQQGAPSSYCWSDQEGGPSKCYTNDQQSQATYLPVRSGDKVLLKIDALIPPDQESVRPFQGSRSGYPSHQFDPALQTDLTIDLQAGKWSMDLCATWHSRGQPICWLFALDVHK